MKGNDAINDTFKRDEKVKAIEVGPTSENKTQIKLYLSKHQIMKRHGRDGF